MDTTFRTTWIPVLTAALCLATPNTFSAEDKTDKDVIQAHAPHKASQLLKMSVVNKADEKLGAINDLAIEVPSGRLVCVLVSSGGVLGVGDKLKPVPPGALMAYTEGKDSLTLDVPKDRWENAPTVKKENGRLTALGDEAQTRQIYTYYNQEWRKEWSVKAGPAEIKIDLPKQTGRTTNEIRLASELMGKEVFSRDQQSLGRLNDFLIDLSAGQANFAIITPGKKIEADEHGYALAPRLLNLAQEKQFVATVDRSTLDQAPLLERDKSTLPDILRSAMGAFRYRETAPPARTGADKDKDGVLDKNQPEK